MKCYLLSLFLLCSITQKSIAQKNDPRHNLTVFCEILDKNYASFREKNVDWQQQCKIYQSKVSATTPDSVLFQYMREMLTPLNDAHVSLKSKSLGKSFSATRHSTSVEEFDAVPKKERKPLFKKMTATTLEANGFDKLRHLGPAFRCETLFSYANNGKIGYLRFFRSFSHLYLMNGLFLNHQLNTIFKTFEGLESVIIDVRFNIGGDDGFSQKIISRFIEKERVVYFKQTRKNGVFQTLKAITVKPKRKQFFDGSLVLLTNDRTVSAADVLALMAYSLPQATIIGTPSNGSYSDLMSRRLPNGWKLTLSNQRYLALDSTNFEGKGTPIDIKVGNKLKDIMAGHDAVLKAAM